MPTLSGFEHRFDSTQLTASLLLLRCYLWPSLPLKVWCLCSPPWLLLIWAPTPAPISPWIGWNVCYLDSLAWTIRTCPRQFSWCAGGSGPSSCSCNSPWYNLDDASCPQNWAKLAFVSRLTSRIGLEMSFCWKIGFEGSTYTRTAHPSHWHTKNSDSYTTHYFSNYRLDFAFWNGCDLSHYASQTTGDRAAFTH